MAYRRPRHLRLDDGTPARLRLVATVTGGAGSDLLPAVWLPAERVTGHTAAWSLNRALVSLPPEADITSTTAALNQRLADQGAIAVPRENWLGQIGAEQHRITTILLAAILGMAVLYAAIAILNTLVMAVRERSLDLAQLRLAGATPWQAVQTVLWEGGFVCVIGVGLGFAVTAAALVATTAAHHAVAPHAQPALPIGVFIVVAAGCVALVLATSLITGEAAQRRRPLDVIAMPE